MPWFVLAFIIYFAVNTGYVISKVGQPRKPWTGGDIISYLIIVGLILWALLYLSAKAGF